MDTSPVASPVALVHGAGWPAAEPAQVAELFAALDRDPSAVVAVLLGPQTDTLKTVDGAGLVTGTLDRDSFRAIRTPIAVRPSALPDAARRPARPGGPLPDAPAVLAAAVAAGCPVVEVTLPG